MRMGEQRIGFPWGTADRPTGRPRIFPVQRMSTGDVRLLERTGLFDGLPPEAMADLSRKCGWARYAPGRQVVTQQDASTELYLIASGSLRVIGYSPMGKAVSFNDLHGPGFFGEFSAIDERPRSASVVALSESLVGRLASADLRRVMREHPDVALQMLTVVTAKARALTDRVFEFSVLNADARLHIELLRMAGLLENTDRKGRIVQAPTHQALAERISSHREAVSLELRRLKVAGAIEYRRGYIEITDADVIRDGIRAAGF